MKMLNNKFPRSLDSLKVDIINLLSPEMYSDVELIHLVEATEKKAIRADKFVKTHLENREEYISECTRSSKEIKALKDLMKDKQGMDKVYQTLESLCMTVIRRNKTHKLSEFNTGDNAIAIEWIRSIFGESLFLKMKEMLQRQKVSKRKTVKKQSVRR